MAEQQHERSEGAPVGRAPSDARSFTWRTLAISVAVAVALSVTTMLLGGASRFARQGAPGGCCGTLTNQVR